MTSTILTPQSPRWKEFVNALGKACGFREDSDTWQCDHDYRRAEKIMLAMGGIDIPRTLEYFQSNGGWCDCEILFNVAS
jgi:hypothetical protein